MIHLGARNKEADIAALLSQYYNPAGTRAWMTNKYHPETILYADRPAAASPALQDHLHPVRPFPPLTMPQPSGTAAFLQMQPLTFLYRGKKAALTLLESGMCDPCLPDDVMADLMAHALRYARKTSLLCALHTRRPEQLQRLGFVPLCSLYSAWIDAPYLDSEAIYTARTWDKENLYPVYRRFMDLFDGSVVLSEAQFDAIMNAARMEGCDLWVMERQDSICGFALYDAAGKHPVLKTVVYDDVSALRHLCDVLLFSCGPFFLQLSGSEPLREMAEEWQRESTFCVQVQDAALFARFDGSACGNSEQILQALKRPAWNFLM